MRNIGYISIPCLYKRMQHIRTHPSLHEMSFAVPKSMKLTEIVGIFAAREIPFRKCVSNFHSLGRFNSFSR